MVGKIKKPKGLVLFRYFFFLTGDFFPEKQLKERNLVGVVVVVFDPCVCFFLFSLGNGMAREWVDDILIPDFFFSFLISFVFGFLFSFISLFGSLVFLCVGSLRCIEAR